MEHKCHFSGKTGLGFHEQVDKNSKYSRSSSQWIFCPQLLFRFETSSVHFASREIDIAQKPIDDLASKVIKSGKESR